jgi:hypothetical protein
MEVKGTLLKEEVELIKEALLAWPARNLASAILADFAEIVLSSKGDSKEEFKARNQRCQQRRLETKAQERADMEVAMSTLMKFKQICEP